MTEKNKENIEKNIFNNYDMCPKCKGKNIKSILPFDFMKYCNDCKEEFVGNSHN